MAWNTQSVDGAVLATQAQAMWVNPKCMSMNASGSGLYCFVYTALLCFALLCCSLTVCICVIFVHTVRVERMFNISYSLHLNITNRSHSHIQTHCYGPYVSLRTTCSLSVTQHIKKLLQSHAHMQTKRATEAWTMLVYVSLCVCVCCKRTVNTKANRRE